MSNEKTRARQRREGRQARRVREAALGRGAPAPRRLSREEETAFKLMVANEQLNMKDDLIARLMAEKAELQKQVRVLENQRYSEQYSFGGRQTLSYDAEGNALLMTEGGSAPNPPTPPTPPSPPSPENDEIEGEDDEGGGEIAVKE